MNNRHCECVNHNEPRINRDDIETIGQARGPAPTNGNLLCTIDIPYD